VFNAIAEVSQILQRTLDAGVQNVGAQCVVHDLVSTPSIGMTLTRTASLNASPDLVAALAAVARPLLAELGGGA